MDHPWRTEAETGVIAVQMYTVRVGKKTLLKEISLVVEQSEIFGVVGPSGSGKTTLLKAIAGTGRVGSGQITVLGHRMPSARVRGRLGYMAQSDALYEDLTGRENLSFFAGLYDLSGKSLKSRFHAVVRLVELERDLDKLVRDYSGGMKRRLSLATSMLHNPKILLLDEPTVGVDPVLRRAFWREFQERKAAGATLVITTHVMDEAMRCDRLAFIRDGRLIAMGTPAQLLTESGSKDLEEAFVYYAEATQDGRPDGTGREHK